MKRFIINILLILAFIIIYFLHSNLFTWFKIAGVMPNLFVILVLFIGLYANKYMGVIYGIVFGLLIDLFIGKKIGITALEALDMYPLDSLRYHLVSNGPERKDTNFSPEDFIATHNGELLNKFGNLVNRTIKFKGLEKIKVATLDENIKQKIEEIYTEVGNLIEKLEFREATSRIINLVETANKYYDEQEPWKQIKENEQAFQNTIFTCSTIIANLSNLFEPIMPGTAEKIRKYLELPEPNWKPIYLKKEIDLSHKDIQPLFERLK